MSRRRITQWPESKSKMEAEDKAAGVDADMVVYVPSVD
jgi:hypothetical protein